MARQTTVQDSNTVRFGSAKIEAGATVGALVDVGAANNVVFTETWDAVRVKSHNAGTIKVGIQNQMAKVTFDMLETNLTRLNALRGGIDTYSTTAGVLTTVTDESVTLDGVTATRLAYANGDGSIAGSIVVTNGAAVVRTLNTDYTVGVDSAGYTVITRIAGGAISDGETVLVDYTYTPNTAKNLSSGGKFTMTQNVLRLTNTNAAGKKYEITFYKTNTAEGINFTYNDDDNVEPDVTSVVMECERDESLAAGAQLFTIVDEQAP